MRVVVRLAPLLFAAVLLSMVTCRSSSGPTEQPSGDAAPSSGSGSGGPVAVGDSAPVGDVSAGGSDASPGTGDSGEAEDAGASGCPMLIVGAGPTSKWARVDAPGHLAYATLPSGERLLDFSWAGYMGGGVAIPKVPVMQTVQPSGGSDDTAPIQAAIDAVSKLPATAGIRGAVLLTPGTFQLQGSLSLSAPGVVLRGSGSGSGGTVLQVGGAPRTAITVAGSGSWKESTPSSAITNDYVASGATSVHLASTAGFSVGATVLVDRPITAAWIHFMGMDALYRNGAPETWIPAGSVSHFDRTIVGITGDTVTLDAPIADTFDYSKWGAGAPRATMQTYAFPGRIEQVGVESMRLVAPPQTVPMSQPTFQILQMDAVQNGWISDVAGEEFTTGFVLGGTTKWVTIQDSSVTRVAPVDDSAGYPFHFSVDGQGILVQRCTSSGEGVFSYGTEDRANGPNVVLRMNVPVTDAGTNDNLLEPHQRWATGLLVDQPDMPGSAINLMNRGYYGSGHGWAIGFGVVWNGVASSLLIQQPPGAQNWSIGSIGMQQIASAPGSDAGPLPQGIIDSQGTPVTPESLYLAQLCERLGPKALNAIGY